MHVKKAVILAVAAAAFLIPGIASAQNSSLNTFSPYTLYGVGDLSIQGNSQLRAMGGAGVAYRDTYINPFMNTFNNLNPASYSGIPRKLVIFNIDLEGQNFYLRDGDGKKSSFNTFNITNIGLLIPLANKLGFGFSVSPYSSVGYRLERVLTDEEVVGNVGDVRFKYLGEGDINQIKAGLGFQLFKDFHLGANLIYYMGYIDRSQTIEFIPYIAGSGFTNTQASMSEDISRVSADVGFQYNVIADSKKILTLGGTYRMGGRLQPDSQYYIPSNNPYGDTVFFSNRIGDLSLPDVFSAGAYYHTRRVSAGADYTFSNWGSRNSGLGRDGLTKRMEYTNTHTLKAGMQYTPDRLSLRSIFKRMSYRMGVRYDQNYMTFGGHKINDKAVTLGLGIPLRVLDEQNTSFINLGFEVGQQGTTRNGLIRSDYFKISIGLNFLGKDYWFNKMKYD